MQELCILGTAEGAGAATRELDECKQDLRVLEGAGRTRNVSRGSTAKGSEARARSLKGGSPTNIGADATSHD